MFSDKDETPESNSSIRQDSRRRKGAAERGRKGRAREMGRCKVPVRASFRFRFPPTSKAQKVPGFRRAGFLYLGAGRVRAPKVPASLGGARIDTSLACVLTRSGNARDLAFRWM
ncbi:hypothetical protein CCMA1212_003813 [Trichoderma ghanense]|uniref:Uncharacterized protein n=1 Tax=Trichoderma ghanense TaxID=65468 RepID=A0ABY2H812_9HYPO